MAGQLTASFKLQQPRRYGSGWFNLSAVARFPGKRTRSLSGAIQQHVFALQVVIRSLVCQVSRHLLRAGPWHMCVRLGKVISKARLCSHHMRVCLDPRSTGLGVQSAWKHMCRSLRSLRHVELLL